MSAMLTTIQNYLYEQDYRTKPRKNFILENMKNLQQLQIKAKDKSNSKVETKKDSSKKRFIRKGHTGGDQIIQNLYLNSNSGFNLPVTPETEIQNVYQKSQGCQTMPDGKDAYRDGVIVSARLRSQTPSPPRGMKSVCVQVEGDMPSLYNKYVPLLDEGAMGDMGSGLKEVPLKQDGKVDFVKLNAIVPLKKKKCPAKVDRTKAPATYQKGVLPKYLVEAKKQHVEDVQEKGLVEVLDASENPEDHICLSEDEKKDHIKKMRKAYAKLVEELNTLPMRSDSMKIRKKREEIEQALQNIEDGIKMFSRNKLYVKATTIS